MANSQSSSKSTQRLIRLAMATGLAGRTFAAEPIVSQLQPCAAVPGAVTEITFKGEHLSGATELWTSFPCEKVLKEPTPVFTLKIPKTLPPGLGAIRLVTTNGVSRPRLFLLDPIPTGATRPTNDEAGISQRLTAPGALEGVCGDVRSDVYKIAAYRGAHVVIEVVAQRLGSPLDPLLRLLDIHGHELAATDDTPELGSDARLDFRCPKTGDYLVEIRDTRYAGGPQHQYRLRLGQPLPAPLAFLSSPEADRLTSLSEPLATVVEREPNDGPSQAQPVTLPVEVAGGFAEPGDRDNYEFHAEKGDRLLFRGRTRSLGSPCDLFLEVLKADGTKVAEANASGADEGLLTNRFDQAGTYHLRVEELNHRGGRNLFYRLAMQRLTAGFTLSVETEHVSVPPGESFEIAVQAQRRDYNGPITLRLAGFEPNFVATNSIIAEKSTTANLKVTIPPGLALGQLRHFTIAGVATIGGRTVTELASTLPALRALFPDMRYPPRELDGLIALGIAASKSTPSPASSKKRKK
jgi:hypothetical protein